MECIKCKTPVQLEDLSKKQRKRAEKNGKATCKTCTEKAQQEIMKAASNKVKKIKLKLEAEIILQGNSIELSGQDNINKELNKFTPRKGIILALDLHDTLDLFKGTQEIEKLASLKNCFAGVIVVSFVGKGTNNKNSKRFSAILDIQEFIDQGVADFGVLVFQRGPAKGWMCDTLCKVFNRTLLFSDDSDDHLESVTNALGKNLVGLHKSDPSNPDGLMDWINKK